MSIEKSRSVVVALVAVALAGCGLETTPVASYEQALNPAVAERPARVAAVDTTVQFDRLASLQGPTTSVVAHSLDVEDGTQVQFMLGLVGCGIMVVAAGTATVTNGTFEVPYDVSATEGFEEVGLYYRIGSGTCDDANPQVFEISAPLPGTVDLSQALVTYSGCWMFDRN